MAQLRRGFRGRGRRIHPALIAAGLVFGFPLIMAVLGVAFGLLMTVLALAVSVAVLAGPFVLFGLGLAALARGRRRKVGRRQAGVERRPRTNAVPQVTADPISRLPEGVQARIEEIRRKAWGLLQHAERFPAASESLYLVRRTLDEYLPGTVNTYLALPPGADDRPVAPDGRTALQVLREQLDVLDRKLDEIAGDLWSNNIERLLANGRFLNERFGPLHTGKPTTS
jgi:hypothetical protein